MPERNTIHRTAEDFAGIVPGFRYPIPKSGFRQPIPIVAIELAGLD